MRDGLDRNAMAAWLTAHFSSDAMPVMVALLQPEVGDHASGATVIGLEMARGFVVPNDWRARAGDRMQRTVLRAAGD